MSIIIPIYNTASYIHRAIESSLRQTHTNVEVLIIDDGSTDKTLEIAQHYAENDSRIKVFHQENAGVSSARNHGIGAAKGDYIVFLDSDDWLEDDAVKLLLESQMKYPDMMAVSNMYRVILDKENFLRYNCYSSISKILSIEDTLYAYCNNMLPPTMATKIFKTDVIRQYNLSFKTGIHYGEDILFTFEYLIKMNGCCYMSKPLYNYFYRQGSAMNNPILKKKNKEDWISIVVTYPNISNEIRTAVKILYGKVFRGRIHRALTTNADCEYIKNLRSASKIYMRSTITSNRVTFSLKMYFICLVYLPRSLSKLVVHVWDWLKSRRNAKKSEAIPYW